MNSLMVVVTVVVLVLFFSPWSSSLSPSRGSAPPVVGCGFVDGFLVLRMMIPTTTVTMTQTYLLTTTTDRGKPRMASRQNGRTMSSTHGGTRKTRTTVLHCMEQLPPPSSSSSSSSSSTGSGEDSIRSSTSRRNTRTGRRNRKSVDPSFMYEEDERFMILSTPVEPAAGPSKQKSTEDHEKQHQKQKYKSNSRKKNNQIEVVSFGSSIGSHKNDDDSTTQQERGEAMLRTIPCVPTLDLYDGPLPTPGSYVVDGNPSNDPKQTCRIGISVNYGDIDSKKKSSVVGRGSSSSSSSSSSSTTRSVDVKGIVDQLHHCIDCGFNTFQFPTQRHGEAGAAAVTTNNSDLHLLRLFNQRTPSWISRHWALTLDISSYCTATGSSSTLSANIRHDVVDLLQRSSSDAIDSLQIMSDDVRPSDAVGESGRESSRYIVDVIDQLLELQREGLIRSIATRYIHPSVVDRINTELGIGSSKVIDHQQHDCNLILPAPSTAQDNLWFSNPLASGLLSEVYNTNLRWRKSKSRAVCFNPHQTELLQRWWSIRDERHTPDLHTPRKLNKAAAYNHFQSQVLDRLSWIALKHQVSMEAIAIRWSLECGDSRSECFVSSVIIDGIFSHGDNDRDQTTDLRRVFTFKLDDEDKELLGRCSAHYGGSTHTQGSTKMEYPLLEYTNDGSNKDDDDDYPEIDFTNPSLWL